MILKEKERSVIEDLQTQEKSCVEKYGKYAEQARDPELKNLFRNIQQEEQKHYESLSMILSGSVPECNCNDRSGRDYQPKAVYTAMSSPEDKEHDAFLATDCIGTEKLVSGTYNDDVFAFGDSGVRKLLADIQIDGVNCLSPIHPLSHLCALVAGRNLLLYPVGFQHEVILQLHRDQCIHIGFIEIVSHRKRLVP